VFTCPRLGSGIGELTESVVCASATEIPPPHSTANNETAANPQAPKRRPHPIVMMPHSRLNLVTAERSQGANTRAGISKGTGMKIEIISI
jgi:hypothetical protein